MKKTCALLLTAAALLLAFSGSARADNGYIDPALTDQNTYCWDSTFQVWIQCSPIIWSTNPDPNNGSGGQQQCPTVNDLGTCLKSCDCDYEHNKSTCGSNKACLDNAVSQQKQCYERCSADWP
jgi:hypothetical protein